MDKATAQRLAAILEDFYSGCSGVLHDAQLTMPEAQHALFTRSVAHVFAVMHDELGLPTYHLYPELLPDGQRLGNPERIPTWATRFARVDPSDTDRDKNR